MYEYHYHFPSRTYYRRRQLGPAQWQVFVAVSLLKGHWQDTVCPPSFDARKNAA
jgi:hypothetical protein